MDQAGFCHGGNMPASHDNDDDDDPLWIKTDGSSAALIDSKADRWQSQLGCG